MLTCFLLAALPVLQYNAVRCVFCTVLGLLLGSIYYRVGLQLTPEGQGLMQFGAAWLHVLQSLGFELSQTVVQLESPQVHVQLEACAAWSRMRSR